jgi:hypothetical protein
VISDDCGPGLKPIHDQLRCLNPRCQEDACVDFRAELREDAREPAEEEE